ncbi:amidohydrolase family protein [Allorhizocola rhizosphaerae]|uniref:amidohydrolase family protein n=1 Tax=Allorhizocola rhizosphaerae TaxID=1872709 RepID=UPI000E3EDCA5|nr:amidohydrolase family protein [Allorhizocola rhizosphaerae]
MVRPVIDVHTHVVPRGWPRLEGAPWVRVDSEREAMIMVGENEFRAIGEQCWDSYVRLTDMADDGVDRQVISPTPVFFCYDRPPAVALNVAKIFNDLTLAMAEGAPDRLIPFCQVPLQDPDLACRELDRCLANGHRGVEIGNHVGERDLDDPGIVTFLQHCASVGAPVFVHPWDMPVSSRVARWMGQWLVGMPAETHLSILALILGGVFDRVSPDLRICFAHGGGSFAFWLGRADNAWHKRNDVVRGLSERPPSHYVGRFYVDSVVFDPPALRLLVDVMGEDRVVLGSDYPYPLGERPVGLVVRKALSPAQQEKVLSTNALRFLGMA